MDAVLTEVIEDSILLVTINRPKALNAINKDVMDGLKDIFAKPQPSHIVGVIIQGAGEKAFVAGADIKEFSSLSAEEGTALSAKGQAVFQSIEDYPIPVIALVRGYALGGGCELAMACHFRVGNETATFGQPEVNLGLLPGYGGTQRLPKLIGRAKALEYLLTANMIKADEALNLGLLNHIYADEDLMPKTVKLLTKIGGKGPLAVAKTIEAFNAGPSKSGYELESDYFGKVMVSDECKEGVTAFIEKRKANFRK